MSVAVSVEISAVVSTGTPPGFAVHLNRLPCRGVSYVTKHLHLEPHTTRVNFIIVRALFESGINLA